MGDSAGSMLEHCQIRNTPTLKRENGSVLLLLSARASIEKSARGGQGRIVTRENLSQFRLLSSDSTIAPEIMGFCTSLRLNLMGPRDQQGPPPAEIQYPVRHYG